MYKGYNDICQYLPERLNSAFIGIDNSLKSNVSEIRLKTSSPIVLRTFSKSLYINIKSEKTVYEKGLMLFDYEMADIMMRLCDMSFYAHEETLKEGFITLKGGHRAGVAGSAVIKNGEISGVKNISSINLRIARDVKGCSDEIVNLISENGNICNSIILSPPGGGKTTIIRDIARNFSERGKVVCIVDERSEISGSYDGIPGFDLKGCDVLNAYPKSMGILQALRTMSPELIVCDELGSYEEACAVLQGMNSGVSFIVTAHASSVEEAKKREVISSLIHSFKKAVVLYGADKPGKMKSTEEIC